MHLPHQEARVYTHVAGSGVQSQINKLLIYLHTHHPSKCILRWSLFEIKHLCERERKQCFVEGSAISLILICVFTVFLATTTEAKIHCLYVSIFHLNQHTVWNWGRTWKEKGNILVLLWLICPKKALVAYPSRSFNLHKPLKCLILKTLTDQVVFLLWDNMMHSL